MCTQLVPGTLGLSRAGKTQTFHSYLGNLQLRDDVLVFATCIARPGEGVQGTRPPGEGAAAGGSSFPLKLKCKSE